MGGIKIMIKIKTGTPPSLSTRPPLPNRETPNRMKTLLALASLAFFTMSTIAADGPVFHIVHFKFKADATPAQIASVEKDFAALKGKIDVVQTLEWGTDISPEKLSDGFTHCWVLTFKNEKDRDAYIAHPAHAAFVATLGTVLEKPLVVDFIPKK